MSKSRSISNEIRLSQSFSRLTLRQRDLWHGLIATADDQGRLPGLAAAVRSIVWPYDDIELTDVETDILALQDSGYIIIYENGHNEKYIQIIKWWHYQKMQWAGSSKYPSPDGWKDRERYHSKGRKIITKNWKTPGGFFIDTQDDNVKVNVNVNDNDNVKRLSKSHTTKVDNKGSDSFDFIKYYSDNVHVIGSGMLRDQLIDYENDCSNEWLKAAVDISVENNVHKWSYVKAILDNWLKVGYMETEKAKSDQVGGGAVRM